MKLEDVGDQPCDIARALAEIGDTWTLLMVRQAFYGGTRFSDFVKYTGAQKTIVSDRLKRLVEADILVRNVYSEHPLRYDYILTDKGRALAPLLLVLARWGSEWAGPHDSPVIPLVHDGCGERAVAEVVCGHCGDPLDHSMIRPDFDAYRLERPRTQAQEH